MFYNTIFSVILANKLNQWIDKCHTILYGHRSVVNQVRYNPQKCIIASSGVEKVIKLWQPFEADGWIGNLTEELNAPENPREVCTHDQYVTLWSTNNANSTHDYTQQNTAEDPRMMAFFDSLVQREIEGWNSDDSSDSDLYSNHSSESSSRQTSTQQSDSDAHGTYHSFLGIFD